MPVCPRCRTSNPADAVYCMRCGLRLAAFCAGCGMRLPLTALVCVRCGLAAGARPPLEVRVPGAGEDSASWQEPDRDGQDAGPTEAEELRPQMGVSAVVPMSPTERQWVGTTRAPARDRGRRPEPPDPMLARLKRLLPPEYVDRLAAMRGQVAGERRIVTILFSDVKGSTAMAESLDPEDVMEIMNGAFEVLIPPIAKYEGTLARLMGDAILAFFGAPLSHENDPERAIRAALEIVAGAQHYAERLFEERGISGFDVRVGINTGLVVVGEVGADMRVEYTAMGDAINLAARMEQNAPPGGILISEDTYLQIGGLFNVEGREPIAVKGKVDPVRVYVVTGARSRTFHTVGRGVAGVTAPMVGRERELHTLVDAWDSVRTSAEAAVITVVGDAGVGKSRLLREFEQHLDDDPLCTRLRGRAAPELQRVPYALLRSLFTFWLQIQDNDPTEVARAKFVEGLVRVFGEDEQCEMRAHFIGHLLGFDYRDSPHLRGALDDPKQVHDRALAYLQRFFTALGERGPVVMLLEDLHWADDSSLGAISDLVHGLHRSPLLTVGLTRPLLFERWAGWDADLAMDIRVDLAPLSRNDSGGLLAGILHQVDEVPVTLLTMVTESAEGNPLYIEELVNVLITEGVIVPAGEEPWHVDVARMSELRIPPSLRGILQARIDSLMPSDRTVLQRASVVGRIFWDQAIVYISQVAANTGEGVLGSGVDVVAVAPSLMALTGCGLIERPDRVTFAGIGEYAFYQAMMRDVTYESMLRRSRRVYHGWVAEWLISHSGVREGEVSGLIAEHLELAQNYVEAIWYLRHAADHAAARYANAEAVRYYSRALAILDEAPVDAPDVVDLRYRLRLGREAVYHILGEREAQAGDLEAMQALLAASGGPERQAALALRWAAYYEATSDFPASLDAAKRAAVYAREAEDTRSEAEGLLRCGISWWRQGELDAGGRCLSEALRVAQDNGHSNERAWVLLNLGVIAYYRGDYEQAQGHWEQALDAYRATGDQRKQARCLSNLVATNHSLGDPVKARALSAQALVVYRALSDRRGEADALCNLAGVGRELGDLGSAREHYLAALDIYRVIGEQGGEALTLDNLALTLHEDGQNAEAVTVCERALAIERAILDRMGEAATLNHLGLAWQGGGEMAPAAEAFAAALDLHLELGQDALAVDDRAGLALIAMQQGGSDQAVGHAESALAWIDGNGIEGIEDPLRVLSIVSQVLGGDGQTEAAARMRASGCEFVAVQAARISDPQMRRSYLARVPAEFGVAALLSIP